MRYHWLILVLLLALVLSAALAAPRPKPLSQGLTSAPQTAAYTFAVTLDPTTKTVRGEGRITYTNPATDPLGELWLHLYLKAFSADDTVWMRESGGRHRGFAADATRGDLTLTRLTLQGGGDLLATSTLTDTLLRVPLPTPLAPGQAVTLEVAWTSLLPRVFARTGYGGRDDTFFMVGQWYPKLAVYDRGQWDTEPWHLNSEFFHDFGRYEITITAPAAYVIAATGLPAGEATSAGELQSQTFVAENVSDFAFAASPDFQVHTTQAGPTEVKLFLLPEHQASAQRYLKVAADSLLTYGAWYGAYPHARLTVVDVPANAGGAGGMEYPTLITASGDSLPLSDGYDELVIAHEIGHQWWPMQTATNEAREPWLDEGLTEYSGARLMETTGRQLRLGPSISAATLDWTAYASQPAVRADLPAWAYGGDYAIGAYCKPAVGLITLERVVGAERFRNAMAAYLAAWRYRHPTAADFRAVMERELGDLSWFFDDFIATTGQIDYRVLPIANGTVTIERTGSVRVPTTVLVSFANGATQTYPLDGIATRVTLTLPPGAQPVTAVVDPAALLFAEVNQADNAASTTIQPLPTFTLAARLVFWLQTIVQTIGLFG